MKIAPNTGAYTAQAQNKLIAEFDDKQINQGKIAPTENKVEAKSTAMLNHEKQETARTLFYAQTIASSQTDELEEESSAVQDFFDYMDKTPEEKWRERILSSMGLTEESLAMLPAEEQQKIEKKIEMIIEEKTQEAIRENNKSYAAQKTESGADATKVKAADLSDVNVKALAELDEKVAQMLNLPEGVENKYRNIVSSLDKDKK